MFGLKRLARLRAWRELVGEASKALEELGFVREIYVFGSVVKGNVSGASDIDLLVVVDDSMPVVEAKLRVIEVLEKALGESSALFDVHVVAASDLNHPPFSWLVRGAVKVK